MKNKDNSIKFLRTKVSNESNLLVHGWAKNFAVAFAAICIMAASLFGFAELKTAFADVSESNATSNAETQVYLKSDPSQLKFTAPTSINFALDGDGNFTCPTNVQFKNDSIMDIEIDGYTVVSESGSTGVEDADASEYASQEDVYSVKVTPTHNASSNASDYVFSKSWSQSDSADTNWEISATEKFISLVFSDGRMPNPSRQWADSGKKLQTVTWSVKMAD